MHLADFYKSTFYTLKVFKGKSVCSYLQLYNTNAYSVVILLSSKVKQFTSQY